MKNLSHTLRLAAASLLILTACAGAQPPADTPNGAVALWQQIQSANSNLSCDSDSQCHTIGVGAKACGGPENYLAWSSKNSDGAQLKALVQQHATARRADDARQGMMSTCTAISDPGASCRAGQCVINTRTLAIPADVR
ncbi:hypothetical protein GJ699_28460 [Duganella sp. FT80W]|uniref:DUF4189 domain-containing protein n=1 Tax=Duganella guangzhouensis TaxID=2666084 RepID=A0A6I2LCE6_9BURK|nr:hypothetical protein [Duganella guangzhouensis]MRW93929.1 hypothetical protein [Duganella guangzhouensis]